MNIKRVLKAPTQSVTDFAALQPFLDDAGFLYASDKEDGIRCITHPIHGVVSQTMKPIPNDYIRSILAKAPLCLDGELVAIAQGTEGKDLSFNDTQSAVMSKEGRPKFQFRVFDCFKNIYAPYDERNELMHHFMRRCKIPNILTLCQKLCETVSSLECTEQSALSRGKEGIMLRHPRGWYKEGRSTFNEAYLLKVKRFEDDEAVVIDIQEEQENCSPANIEISGLSKRPKRLDALRGKRCVGKLICNWHGKTITIGSGLNASQKFMWWRNQNAIIGKTITFKFQRHGMKDLPRAPIFKGIRHDA